MIDQRKLKNVKNFRDFSLEWKDACKRKIDGKIVAFFSDVVYYFGDLLKSATRALLQNKTFISL